MANSLPDANLKINVNSIDPNTFKIFDELSKIDTTKLSIISESLSLIANSLEQFKSINLDKIKINYILVEDNYNNPDLHGYLLSKNYSLVEVISIDKLYKLNYEN